VQVIEVRERLVYLALISAIMPVGLTVHLRGDVLSPMVRDIAGDALWAAMMVLWMGVLAPGAPLPARAAAAFAVCVLVEACQAFHTPGLDVIRRSTLGHLLLGSGFDARDFAAYAGGVFAAVVGERVVRRAGAPAARP